MKVACRLLWVACVVVLGFGRVAVAHDPLIDCPDPASVPEAWDVIKTSVGNMGVAIETNQLRDVTPHVTNVTRAIRTLQAHLPDVPEKDRPATTEDLDRLLRAGSTMVDATRARAEPQAAARREYAAYQQLVGQLAKHYKASDTDQHVYACPMHPLERSLKADDKCPKCGMPLVRRKIPVSSVYQPPGEPSMTLVATPDAPLSPGREAKVRVTLRRVDGRPVTSDDLLVVHTQRVHLLVVDHTLADYHHEHPKPTDVPGEYAFAFTPRLPGPYRVFADVVPAYTNVQEYVATEIAADAPPPPLTPRATNLTGVVDGYTFQFAVPGSDTAPIRANEAVTAMVDVTGPDGKPFTKLEPVMNAFAHLVGFSEDGRTVVHVHPIGEEVTNPAARGGSLLGFRVYVPKAGYYRFYCQVQIGGQQKFAPFDLNVLPAEK